MRIHFEREGTQAVANIVLAVPNLDERVFSCKFECGGEAYAGLLVEQMQRQLQKEIEAIRQNEYENGWKDKSAHKGPRKSWFASTFQFRNR